MKYNLYVSYVENDRHAVVSWLLSDYTGVVDSDIYIVTGKAKQDANRALHIGLTRALRRSAKATGAPMQLTLYMDKSVISTIGFELIDVDQPKHDGLLMQTQRSLKRFDSWQGANFSDENDLRPEESAVIDDGMDTLAFSETFKGRCQLLMWRLTKPNKVIT
ncbi:hypothetical protein HUG15_00365 [Salicibibacter cibarius]|uniref:Uncharacterized protein n=1 Tax=Salicibibacter cibarius TaxID=2743000 RepID=A0A7T7C9U5_9BACI|nr:hypothetical protein [Salicibibacter cibarius]QQK74222.1 hypothetical protein HUG15_00365 [Salicibibacter cibarius]